MPNRIQTLAEKEIAARPTTLEKHYSLSEIAELWGYSHEAMRRLFKEEPGVIVIEKSNRARNGKRRHRSIRVPESVMNRVYRRLQR